MMPRNAKKTETLADFNRNPEAVLERLRKSGDAMLLKVDDAGEVIVQDAASYQRLVDVVDRLESLAVIKEGLEDAAAGRSRPMREVLAELAEKYHLNTGAGAR